MISVNARQIPAQVDEKFDKLINTLGVRPALSATARTLKNLGGGVPEVAAVHAEFCVNRVEREKAKVRLQLLGDSDQPGLVLRLRYCDACL